MHSCQGLCKSLFVDLLYTLTLKRTDVFNPVHLRICVLSFNFLFFIFKGIEGALKQVHLYNKQQLPKSEKREMEKEGRKAFESVIDEVALFEFKDFQSCSG